jgi:hypothetical protein
MKFTPLCTEKLLTFFNLHESSRCENEEEDHGSELHQRPVIFYRFSIGIDRGKETHTYDTTPALAEFLLLQKSFANPPLYAHGRVRDDAIRAATVPAIASLCGSALSQQYPPQRMYTTRRFQILDAHFSKETRGHQERRQRGQCTETGN